MRKTGVVLALGLLLSGSLLAAEPKQQKAPAPQLTRKQAVYELVLKWGPVASHEQRRSIQAWSESLLPLFATADVANLNKAMSANSYTDMVNALTGTRAPSVKKLAGGVTPKSLGSMTADLVFNPLGSCVIVNTTKPGSGGAMAAGSVRHFKASGVTFVTQGGEDSNCGIPSGVRALLVNVTSAPPSTSGYFHLWPYAAPEPLAANLSFTTGQLIQNEIIVTTSTGLAADFSVRATGASHLIVNVLGYFAAPVATALDCVTVESYYEVAATSHNYGEATCPVGYNVSGGGCDPYYAESYLDGSTMLESRFSGNGYFCRSANRSGTGTTPTRSRHAAAGSPAADETRDWIPEAGLVPASFLRVGDGARAPTAVERTEPHASLASANPAVALRGFRSDLARRTLPIIDAGPRTLQWPTTVSHPCSNARTRTPATTCARCPSATSAHAPRATSCWPRCARRCAARRGRRRRSSTCSRRRRERGAMACAAALLRLRHRRQPAGRAGGGLAVVDLGPEPRHLRDLAAGLGRSRRSPREWLLELFDLPRESGLGFVTGCQMANFTCLAAARHGVLRRAGWDVEADGLHGAPRINLVASRRVARHHRRGHALPRLRHARTAARRDRRAGADARRPPAPPARQPQRPDHRLRAGRQREHRRVRSAARDRRDRAASTARGCTSTARSACGRAPAAEHAHLADGIELADSWATDAHKWLNVPYDCGVAIVRHAEDHRAAMTSTAAYLDADAGRRARRRRLGAGVLPPRAAASPSTPRSAPSAATASRDSIERCCARARADGGAASRASRACRSSTTSCSTRCWSASATTTTSPARVVTGVQQDGTCWLGGTTWQGQAAMRISVSNWATTRRGRRRAARRRSCGCFASCAATRRQRSAISDQRAQARALQSRNAARSPHR